MPLRMTDATKAVLRALATATGETTGYAIAQTTGYGSGTIHPILGRIAKNDLATMRKETPEELRATGAGRPLRTYYTITDAGRSLLAGRERPTATTPQSGLVIQPHATAQLDLVSGDLRVTLGMPRAVPEPKIERVTIRTEWPDGAADETVAYAKRLSA